MFKGESASQVVLKQSLVTRKIREKALSWDLKALNEERFNS